MMWAWSFSCRTPQEVAALLRALGKHRYVREVDHKLHRLVDLVLADQPLFARHAAELASLRRSDPEFDLSSLDPRLWRSASADEVSEALSAFWSGSDASRLARQSLRSQLEALGLEVPEGQPFLGDPEEPGHPQLVQLSWTLAPVVDLDAERHAGALKAMLEAAEEVDVSAPVEQEGPDLGPLELLEGAPRGVLVGEFVVWSEAPYSYADYVFRGASKMAGLVDPPEGERDLDDEEDEGLAPPLGRVAPVSSAKAKGEGGRAGLRGEGRSTGEGGRGGRRAIKGWGAAGRAKGRERGGGVGVR